MPFTGKRPHHYPARKPSMGGGAWRNRHGDTPEAVALRRSSYLSGEIQAIRIDVKALDLVPLGLAEMGMWDPRKSIGEKKTNPSRNGPSRLSFTAPAPCSRWNRCCPVKSLMILSMTPSPDQTISKMPASGQRRMEILMELCQEDLRCLDAHLHLGNLVFDHWPHKMPFDITRLALRIGELSLGNDFNSVLAVGPYRQPPVSALHARLWIVSLAPRAL